MNRAVVTTSWDDGHKLDVRLAKLLKKYNIPATFYISPKDHEILPRNRLLNKQIAAIAEDFEIGAHTMTHPRLTQIGSKRAKQEIVESKSYLENIIGHKITSFCYPGGDYRPKHARMVREAGFTYARTVRRFSFNLKGPMSEGNTSVNTYNHYSDLWKIAKFAKFNPIRVIRYFQWDNLAIAMYDKILREGGVFHLWGHSWEIEDHGDWEKLERVLSYISNNEYVEYVENKHLPTLIPKKLLIAAPYFPPHLGGQEYYAYHIARFLQLDHSWKVCIATTGERGLKTEKTNFKELTVYKLPYLFKLSNTPLSPLWIFWLRRIVKKEDIYIINAHAPVPVFADLSVRLVREIPTVITYHMTSMKKGIPKLDWIIGLYEDHVLPNTMQKAASIICSTDKIRNGFLRRFRSKSHTVNPGVDIDFFTPADKLPVNKLLYVGSLYKSDSHKGLKYLLEALSIIVETHPDVTLTLVGNGGSGIEFYKNMAKQLGIAKNVNITGGKYDKDLTRAYRQASIFVLPTLNESFGMVIVEAMAAGLPVVSTTVGEIPKLVERSNTGYLVKPGDSVMLAQKIQYIIEHPIEAERLGSNGRKKVEAAYSWQIQAKKTHRILLNTLKGKK